MSDATQILFAAGPKRWPTYAPLLRQALEDADIFYDLRPDIDDEDVEYIIYTPDSDVTDFTRFPKLRAVLNLWAGVESIIGNPTLNVPLTRMVDDAGLTQGMVEWVTGHVLRHHLGMDAHIVNPDHIWQPVAAPLSRARPVTILGLGALGQACGSALTALDFPVTGWSRSAKDVPGLTCLSGPQGLNEALQSAQILVLLLPNTPATENIVNSKTLALLPRGAVVINPGRGPLINDADLISALDSGQLSHATLDVFRTEPLPSDHPFWQHPKITVTPHIASETRPETAVHVIVDNIQRSLAGAPLRHLVDKTAGY